MKKLAGLSEDPLSTALELDAKDVLLAKREEFDIPEGVIYLDGNSLGALPKSAKLRATQVIENQWGQDLISSWNRHNWIDLPVSVGEKIAKIIGAATGQTVCCDSISVNLFKLLSAALKINANRTVILTEKANFPTDIYMAQGLQDLLGEARCKLVCLDKKQIENALDEDVAVLMLTQVDFRTGAIHDMEKLTRIAHSKGILVLWDLAHSAGAIPVELDKCNVDFAVGCGYKYLNGGPGAPAFMYVAKRHQLKFQQPLFGWMGHKNAFNFSASYEASEDIKQCLTGTPPILSLSVLDAALEVFDGVDMEIVREKSIGLGEFCLSLMEESGLISMFALRSPKKGEERASQLAFAHADAFAICQALIDKKVICDFRAPDILRLGFTPMYTRYVDIYKAVNSLIEIMREKSYQSTKYHRTSKVT